MIIILVIGAAFILLTKNNVQEIPDVVPSDTQTNVDETPPQISDETPSQIQDSGNISEANDSVQTSNVAGAKIHNIEIRNMAYSPATLTIKKGDTVIWVNYDKGTTHTVTSTRGNELSSSFLKIGENYTHTFNTTGKFVYYCIPHASSHGDVIVV